MASKRRKQLQPRHIAKDHQILTEALENEVLMEYGRSPLRSFDNHICGRCSADFFTMPAFIMHKKRCTNEWPVIVSAPATSSSSLVVMRTTTTTDETKAPYGSDENDANVDVNRYENNADKAIDLYEKSSNPIVDVDENANKMNGKVFSAKLSPAGLRSGRTGVARIQTALASLQRQQMLQLQLIKNIYGQLLKSTEFSISDDVSDSKFFAECTKNNDGTTFTVDSFKINILSSSKQLKRNIAQQLNEQRKSMEKLFETRCQLCDKDVGNLKKLDLHMKNVHGTELISMSQFCEDCYECFKSQQELDDHTRIQHQNIKEEPTVVSVEKENEILLHPTMNFQQNESPPSSLSSTKNTIGFNADGDEQYNDAAEKIIDAIQTSTTTERYMLTNLKFQSNNSNVKNDEIWNQQQDFYCSDISAPGSFLGTSIGQSSTCTPIGPSSRCTPIGLSSQCTPMDFESPTMVNLIKNNNNFDKFESDDSLNFVHISTPDIGDKQHEPISPVESYHDDVGGAKMLLDDDDDWEDLMEVANMDEASEILQLAGDAATKTADRNECIICHKILSCKSALQMHYRTHTGTRPFKCKVCQRAFTTKGNLKTHMSVHKTKSSSKLFYHCPVCQKAFINSSSLHEHLSVHHSGTAPPKVEKVTPTTVFLPTMPSAMARCHNAIEAEASKLHRNGKDLHKDSNGSKIDVASTSIVKQYAAVNNPHETICRICYERFASANLLEIHMNSHARKKPYICEMCGRGFSTRGNLKQHRDSIHFSSTPGTPNNNNGREQNFDFQALNGEIGDRLSSRSHSEPDNQTTSADNKHSNLELVRNNAKNDSSVRNEDMNLTSSSSSSSACYNNKTLCHICMKQCCSPSILQIHMRSHTGDRPFECNVCSRSFSTKGNLKAHMEIHTYSSDSLRGRRYFSTVMPKTLKFREQKNVDAFRISRRNSKTLSVERQSPLKSPVFPASSFNPVMHNNFNRSLAFLPHNQPFYEPTVSTDSLMFRPEFSMGGFQPNFNQHLMNGFNNVSSSTNDPSSVYHPNKSMDAMVQMFRVVCSLCHKVCSSTSELEIHLKTHFCQSDVNIQVLKT